MANQWSLIDLKDKKMLLSFKLLGNGEGYEIILTDMIVGYREKLESKSEVRERLEQFNPDLEVGNELDGLEELKVVLSGGGEDRVLSEELLDGGHFKLSVDWVSEGIPFSWEFQLQKIVDEELYKMITLQLVRSVSVLMEERSKLFSIIRDKDLELEDLQTQGAVPTLPQLKTKKFNQHHFLSSINPLVLDDPLTFFVSPNVQQIFKKGESNNEDILKKEENNAVTENGEKDKSKSIKSPVKVTKLGYKKKVERTDLVHHTDKKDKNKRARLANI